MTRINRTCTEVRTVDDGKKPAPESHPLKDYREVPAYVLLGDPGAGKTTAFEMEYEAVADGACCIDARDFVTFDPDAHPEWCGKTLFIDALDEVRAGSQDARTPFDAIRRHLDKLGRPRFRLSCRDADWIGENDRKRLASVVPHDSRVTVLRLDPMKRADVERILDARNDITDGRGFIDEAVARGVDALLGNPLTLRLLADVVSHEGRWPRTRLELFEQASMLLATEYNEEHGAADPEPSPAELLDAAGRLCAVHLVSGAVGYALGHAREDAEYLQISQCEFKGHQILRRALATRLFTARAEGQFVPIHRHIAEFVGAKHLARVISEDLPASRVLALLTGFDGGVVSTLRGISAWLAALSESARRDLIERDPIGVISYGDVRAFSPEHKEILLQALGREESRLDSVVWTEAALGAIATHGMEPALRKILESLNEHPPKLVALVLYALKHGERLPSLSECLMQVVYGDIRWVQYPAWALEAFIHNCPDQQAALDRLEQLLQDLSAGRVRDWQDQLQGVALHHLYPGRIPPAKIWDYLTESTSRHADDNGSFWRSCLIDRSGPEHIAILLDELATRHAGLKPALESRHLEEFPAELLARGLELRGDSVAVEQLLDWLRVDLFCDSPRTSHEAARRIGAWLKERPEVQRAIVADYVSRSPYPIIDHKIHKILYGSPLPPYFGDWCLQQAREATGLRSAETYLRLALARGVRRDILLEYERETPPLREIMEALVGPRPDGFDAGVPRSATSWRQESNRRRREFVEVVRSHETELRANRGGVQLLEELANVYYGGSSDIRGDNPQDRLRELFGDETHLIDATLAGFRGAPSRGDIPNAHEIVGLLKTGRQYRVALPTLAGIDELDDLRKLNDQEFRQALAFHFTTFTEHAWHRARRLIRVNASVAADVLVQCTKTKIRAGIYDSTVGYQLSVGEYVALASQAVLPLLRSFSVRRAQREAMAMLDELFIAALRHADRVTLLALTVEKLACTSMSAVQRLRWRAVEVVAASDTCVDRLREFVAQRESRVPQLAAFLLRVGAQLDDLPTSTLVAFIEMLGPTLAPWAPTDFSSLYERFGRDPADCVRHIIRTLAERPDQDTSDELGRLCTELTLNRWRSPLEDARDRQLVMLRDGTYRHPTVEQVCRTLDGGTPANAGDLAALLVDRLNELGDTLRTESTDGWSLFWNHDSYGRPTDPKPENSCRKMLQLLLKLPEVDLSGEGSYANNTRADLRAVYSGFEVPVEIKRSQHRQLWSAVRDQLIGKYTSVPATGGYGVYLVVWFGRGLTQAPLEGSIPADAGELRIRLEGTLTLAERRKISVVVMDVSRV